MTTHTTANGRRESCSSRRAFVGACALSVGLLAMRSANAATVDATPANYLTLLPTLKAGDTMKLADGTYPDQLQISNLNGTAAAPIIISGSAATVFTGSDCCNTVEFVNSSYVVVRGFTVDGAGSTDAFAVSAKNGASNFTHHITVEGLTIKGYGADQQTVGISTKTPTWGWIIRGNRITGAGTGIYLGNSDGSSAFFDGVIEGNLIDDPEGYCMQIKHQTPRPSRPGQPEGESRTIIRHNVFIKTDRPSGSGDRPNLLVGGFPNTGAGANDRYEIYGNVLFHNPRESLLQATGRVSIHDNIFIDATDAAILLVNQNLPLKLAHVYNNTIYGATIGIQFGNAATDGDSVMGNLIFASTGIGGAVTNKKENIELTVADAPTIVKAPSKTLGAMDFYPLPGKSTGAALDLSSFSSDTAWDVDFNGTPKTPPIYRGAYHGSGANPGWPIGAGLKDTPSGVPAGDAGTPDGAIGDATPSDGSSSGDPPGVTPDGTAATDESGGCGCGTAGRGTRFPVHPMLVMVLVFFWRRRRLATWAEAGIHPYI